MATTATFHLRALTQKQKCFFREGIFISCQPRQKKPYILQIGNHGNLSTRDLDQKSKSNQRCDSKVSNVIIDGPGFNPRTYVGI